MRYVKVLLLMILPFNATAGNEDKANLLFKRFDAKSKYCLELTHRKIDNFKDSYYESLSKDQRKALLLMLSEETLNRCSSYELSEYLKHIIVHNDQERIQFISQLYNKDLQSTSLKKLYSTIDKNEVNRLLGLGLFATPFDVIDLYEKLNSN